MTTFCLYYCFVRGIIVLNGGQMERNLAKVIKWDGLEGLLEDENGEIIRFSHEDIHPHDLDTVEIGTIVVLTESGFLELTSETFYHYIDEKFDGANCQHKKYVKGVCVACGEVANFED